MEDFSRLYKLEGLKLRYFRVNKLDRNKWERTVHSQVKNFQHKCIWAIKRGYDGKVS